MYVNKTFRKQVNKMSEEEAQFVLANWQKFNSRELSQILNKPVKYINQWLKQRGIKVNGKEIEGAKDLGYLIKENTTDVVNIEFIRQGCKFNKDVELIKEGESYKLGLWVRDSTAGIGTLTFYHEGTNTFGALGHPITDGDTNTTFTIKNGDLLSASILSVRKGEKGIPGELRGLFVNEKSSIAEVQKYIKDMKKARKFDGVTIEREMMLFLEELGELAKAIRKNTNGHLDIAKEYNDNVEEELADCFIYLLSIANMNNVDIFKAFKDKETKNCDRVWK